MAQSIEEWDLDDLEQSENLMAFLREACLGFIRANGKILAPS